MTLLPDFNLAEFEPNAPIDNPYFPLTPGTILAYGAKLEEDEDNLEDLVAEIDAAVEEFDEQLDELEETVDELEEILDSNDNDNDEIEDLVEQIDVAVEEFDEQLEELKNVLDIDDENEDEDNEDTLIESNQVFVTFESKNILGVETVVVRDVAWDEGTLVEDTFDWYAQDTEGNVWYLGEIATNYEYDEEGNFIGTNNDGSWEAGVDGALPGFLMEANPQVGDSYFQ